MPAPTIYRSSDPSAPVLSGTVGALIALLDACLVSGYTGKAAAGWTKPYTTTNGAVYRQGSGSRGMYLQVLDDGTLTGGARDASCFGFETMTAWNTGTGQFPPIGTRPTGLYIRKSLTADAVARPWVLFADSLTFYLFTFTGDSIGYHYGGFGDFYSYNAADAYRVILLAGITTSASTLTSNLTGQVSYGAAAGASGANTAAAPRNFSGVGGPTVLGRIGDNALIGVASTGSFDIAGQIYFPNQGDGSLYLAPLRLFDGSTPSPTAVSGNIVLRGQLRGVWHIGHALSFFADGDTFAGAAGSAFAGRTFTIVRPVIGGAATSVIVVETTAWDTT